MEKEYLLSLEYGILAMACVGVVSLSIEVIKEKIMDYVKKANFK